MKLDVVLKWIATVLLIAGTAVNNLGYQPEGPLVLLVGGVLWLAVSLMWREPALIVTNVVMTLTGAGTLVYKYCF
jgi:hypothetical protein